MQPARLQSPNQLHPQVRAVHPHPPPTELSAAPPPPVFADALNTEIRIVCFPLAHFGQTISCPIAITNFS